MDVFLGTVIVPSQEYEDRVQMIERDARDSGDDELIAAVDELKTVNDNAEADLLLNGGVRSRCEELAGEAGAYP